MPSDENKNINRRWIEAFNERDWATEKECRASSFTAHMSGAPEPLDFGGWDGFMSAFTTAFPDAQITIGDIIGEGDMTSSRWTITGTHRGDFQGIPATDKPVTLQGIEFNRFAEGKVAEHWAQFDLVGLMMQIGALPAPA